MGSDHFSVRTVRPMRRILIPAISHTVPAIRSRVFFDTFMGNLLVVNDVHIECKYIPAADGAMSALSLIHI